LNYTTNSEQKHKYSIKEKAGRFFDPLQTHEVPCHTLRSRVKVCGLKFQLTSLEIAEETGKPHNDVLKGIRKMEQAWVNVTQSKFGLRRKIGMVLVTLSRILHLIIIRGKVKQVCPTKIMTL